MAAETTARCLNLVREQLSQFFIVRRACFNNTAELTLALGRLFRQDMFLECLGTHNFARASFLVALLGCAVGLLFGHDSPPVTA